MMRSSVVGVFLLGRAIGALVHCLDSVTMTAAAKPVRRLGYIYVPMGSNQAQWTPTETGKMTKLSAQPRASAMSFAVGVRGGSGRQTDLPEISPLPGPKCHKC